MTLQFDPIAMAGEHWDRAGWNGSELMMLATSINRAQQIVVGRTNEVLAKHGLTLSRFEALAVLRFSRNGSLALGRLGERLQVHPASVTNTISKLEADGLVERSRHPDDRRTVLATITAGGREVLDHAAAALAGINYGVAPLGDDDAAELFFKLRSVRAAAGDFVIVDVEPSAS